MRNSVKRALVLVLSVLLATGNPGLTALAEDLASSHEGSALVDGGAKSVADDFSVRPADDRAEGRLTEEATGMSVEAQGEAVRLTDVAHAAAESDGSDATQKDAVIATAETDNSSSYTVEFTYGDLGYVLPGGSSVAVSEVLAALGLTGEATAVEVSDASLFSASDESGGWVVTAHRAFSTTERMRVTMGGVAYEITVTDDQDAVTYIDADGTQKTLTAYTPLTGSETAWTGWYVASGEVHIDSRVEVEGEAHLVLVDGAALHIPKGITVNSGNSLTIYGQNYDTGALTIDKVNEYNAAAAGIGGGYYSQQSDGDLDGSPSNLVVGRAGGAVTINGGTVNVVGNVRGTCIGGGDAAGGGAITINGGKVTATSSIINGGGIGNGNLAGGATIELSLPAGGSDFIQASRYSGALRIKEGCALRPDGDTQTFYTDKHNGSIDPSALRNVKLVYCPYPCAVDDQAAHVTSSHKLAPEGWTIMLALEEGYAGLPGVTYSVDGQAHAVDLAKVDDATYTFAMPAYPVTVTDGDIDLIPYTVTVNATQHGMVTPDKATATMGETVTLAIVPDTPAEGRYALKTLTVSIGETEVATKPGENNTYTFTMPAHDVAVSAEFEYIAPAWPGTDESGVYTVPEGGAAFDGIVLTRDTTIDLNGSTLTVDGGTQDIWGSWGSDNIKYGIAIRCEGEGIDSVFSPIYSLTIQGPGTLVLKGSYGIIVKSLYIGGGTIRDESDNGMSGENVAISGGEVSGTVNGGLTMTGGEVSGTVSGGLTMTGGRIVGEISCDRDDGITISGGQVDAAGGIANRTWQGDEYPITLGCSSADDHICAASYTGKPIRISEGQTLYDEDGNAYSDELTEGQVAAIAGRTLRDHRAYAVSIGEGVENGSVAISGDKTRFAENDTVTLDVAPDDGYALDALTYAPEGGEAVAIAETEGVYSFAMPAHDVTVTATFRAVATEPAFRSQALVLSGQIGVNFYADLSMLTDEERRDVTVEFKVGGRTVTDKFDDSCTNPTTHELHGFTCPISSAQMAESITATLRQGGVEKDAATASVAGYVDYMVGHPEAYTAKAVALAEAIADYGHYMTPFIRAYGTGGGSGTNIDARTTYTEEQISQAKSAVAAHALSLADGEGVLAAPTYKLVLGSETSIRVYFRAGEGYAISGAGQIVVTDKATGAPIEKATVSLEGDGRWCVRIPDINAAQLSDRYVVTVTDAEGATATIELSALSYARTVMTFDGYGGADRAMADNAMASLYYYHAAAADYKNEG